MMEKYEELLVSLRKVIRAIDLYSRKLSKESGLTSPQLLILQQIKQQSGITGSAIAKNINLSTATVTNILDRLESRDLIRRQRDSVDKRRVTLFLTEAARAALATAPMPLQENFIENFSALEDWEQNSLIAAMQRIAAMMDAHELDASPILDVDPIQASEGKDVSKP